MEDNNKFLGILMVITLIITLFGGTLAYWNWQSSNAEKTNVTFTVASGFTCGADAGGDISSSQKTLAPAACNNTSYAIQRTVTVSTTQDAGKTIVLDMWLKVNSIASNLSASENFKYALTDSASGCTDEMINDGDTDHVIASGTFSGKTAGSQVMLLDGKQYSQTTASDVYYLYIWLDAAETNSNTMNQSFNFTVEGSCTDELPGGENYEVVYSWGIGGINLGDNVTTIEGRTDDYSALNKPYFLRHVLDENNNVFRNDVCVVRNNTLYCFKGKTPNDELACWGESPYYEENIDLLASLFDVSECADDFEESKQSTGNSCSVSGLYIYTTDVGNTYIQDDELNETSKCEVSHEGGDAYCYEYEQD